MWSLMKEGKVRKVYQDSETGTVALVAGDGVSAFDEKLGIEIPDKGKYLTRMSAFWFQYTGKFVENAFISADNSNLDYLSRPEFSGRTTLMTSLTMLPVELIVRGYITGSAWKKYSSGAREICGVELPEGLLNSSRLPEPIFTPTTKAPEGQHDEDINFERMIEEIKGTLKPFDLEPHYVANTLMKKSLLLYRRAADYAIKRGIIIADTKFEFGLDQNGRILLADELLTPDSSRFWPAVEYEPGKEQNSFDKQIIRNYIAAAKERGDTNVTIPDKILAMTAARYREACRALTS